MPTSYTAAISGQEALECPQVTRQPAALAARQNSTAPGSSAAHVADLMIPRARAGSILGRIGIPFKALGMGADFVRGEIGPVPVDAGDPGAVTNVPVSRDVLHRIEHGGKLCRRPRGGGREDRRRAVPGVGAVGNANRLGRAVHVVAACAAVRVNVDESRTDVAILRVDDFGSHGQFHSVLRTDRDNSIAFNDHYALWQQASRQNHGAPEYDAWHRKHRRKKLGLRM